MLKVVLCDTNAAVCARWRSEWNASGAAARMDPLRVSVHHGAFDSVLHRVSGYAVAVVSPGNSYGFLGGGFDLAIAERLGGQPFEEWLRGQLGRRYHPVGSVSVVDLGGWTAARDALRYVVHVPTVVTPCRAVYEPRRAHVSGYARVFDATWQALASCPADVDVLVVPGLGTGYAGIPAAVACKSMVFALRVWGLGGYVSRDLQNVLIMQFLGVGYDGFFGDMCREECQALGIDWERLQAFDVTRDSIGDILPSSQGS